jgi:outer membrane biosynthesis protein TonB
MLEMQSQINSRLDSVLSEIRDHRAETISTITSLSEANSAMTQAAMLAAAAVASSTLEASTQTEPEPEPVLEEPVSVEVVNPEERTEPVEKPARPKRRTL